MNERKMRGALQFMAWLQKFHPDMAAAISERVGEPPKPGALNQLGESWDMFYPSEFYGDAGYRDRWHADDEHLGRVPLENANRFYKSGGYARAWQSPGLGPYLSGLGQGIDPFGGIGTSTTTTTTTSDGGAWYSDVLSFAKEAIPAYLAYDAQKDIMDMNIERAKQGLPPVDPGMTAPQVKVIHQLPPEVQTSINDFKMGGINVLLWGALAVGGFFLIRAMR